MTELEQAIRAERWLTRLCEGVAPGRGVELAQRVIARQESQGRKFGQCAEVTMLALAEYREKPI